MESFDFINHLETRNPKFGLLAQDQIGRDKGPMKFHFLICTAQHPGSAESYLETSLRLSQPGIQSLDHSFWGPVRNH